MQPSTARTRLHRRARLEALVREVAVEADRRPEGADHVEADQDGHVDPVEGDCPRAAPAGAAMPSGGTTTAISVTTWLMRLVPGRTVPTRVLDVVGARVTSQPTSRCAPTASAAQRPPAGAGGAERGAQREAVQGAWDEPVAALDAEPARPLEALARARRAHAGDSRKPAVQRPVHDVEALAAQPVEPDAVGQPRSQPEHALDTRGVGALHRHGPAHREAEQERARRARLHDGGPCILLAPVERAPRLDAITHLREGERREAPCQAADEPLERGAPGSFHRGGLATVDADDRSAAGRARQAHLRARREVDHRARHAVQPARTANESAPAATPGLRGPKTAASPRS